MEPFLHTRFGFNASGTVVVPFTPPVDTLYLANTAAGAGADNRTNLANWLTIAANSTQALNATNYLGAGNSANTVTGQAASGVHNSVSGLITTGGWTKFGGAFKRSAGNANFVSLYCGVNDTDYSTFNLTTGVLTSNSGASLGTINALANGWYWCQVTLGSQSANATAKWAWGDTAAHATPVVGFTSTTSDIILAGPFACS